MSKRVICLIAAGLLAAAGTCASDAWKEKDFQNWDLKDIQKILTDSPWSKKFQNGGNGGVSLANPALHPLNIGAGGGPSSGGATAGGQSGSPGNSKSGESAGAPKSDERLDLTVSWYSSRTIREAMVRQKELEGVPADDARKELSMEPTTYEVAIFSTDLSAFGKNLNDLKGHSYLMFKTGKEKLTPTNVAFHREKGAVLPTAIIFEFPKTTSSGEPSMASNEKAVEFFTQAGSVPIKIKFDLSKMTDKLGSDY
jgi:hypothetical protein